MKKTILILSTILFFSLVLTFTLSWIEGERWDMWPIFIVLTVVELVVSVVSFFICETFKLFDLAQKLKGAIFASGTVMIFLVYLNYRAWYYAHHYENIEANGDFWKEALHRNPFQFRAIKTIGQRQENPNDYRLIMITELVKDTIMNGDTTKYREETQLYNLGSTENDQTLHFNRQIVFTEVNSEEIFDITMKYAKDHPEIPEYAMLLGQYKMVLDAEKDIKGKDTVNAVKHLNYEQ